MSIHTLHATIAQPRRYLPRALVCTRTPELPFSSVLSTDTYKEVLLGGHAEDHHKSST